MAWIEPKINWKDGDFFNHIDYNRITSNIDYVREMLGLDSLFTPKSIDGYMRVSEYNAITQEIQRLYNEEGFYFEYYGIADRNSYSNPWNANQLNIIESAIKAMYSELRSGKVQISDESKTLNLASEDMNYNIYSE